MAVSQSRAKTDDLEPFLAALAARRIRDLKTLAPLDDVARPAC